MSPEKIALIISVALVTVFTLTVVYRKFPKKMKTFKFKKQWMEIQKKCADQTAWRTVIAEADDLLDLALKKKKISGNSMGERLVKAQKTFTDNDSVWYGHKLRTKIDSNLDYIPKKEEVKKAMLGIRQGLKDVGALK